MPTSWGSLVRASRRGIRPRHSLPTNILGTSMKRQDAASTMATMPKISAGLLMYRIKADAVEVLLAHPGGPFFQNKDDGAWSIPKGEPEPGEELLSAAQREFEEETGLKPAGPFLPLAPVQQKGGKIVHGWAFAGDCDPGALRSNAFTMEWPPRSGRQMEVSRDRSGRLLRSGRSPKEDQVGPGRIHRRVGRAAQGRTIGPAGRPCRIRPPQASGYRRRQGVE